MITDGFIERDTVEVLFKSGRYRVTGNKEHKSYTLWYSGNILRIDSSLKRIMSDFKTRMQEMKGISL